MKHTITLIPGDGIGPEIVAATVRVIEATGVDIEWETQILGAQALEKYGDTLPDASIEAMRRNKVSLKGPIMTPIGKGFTSVNVGLRRALDLYANVRPVKALPNVKCRYPELDLVIVRENTEGLYSGLEHIVVPGVVESLKIITEKASTRIARYAFEYARDNGRKKVTAVHKANIMKLSDGLFLECFYAVAKDFPDIEADDKIIDNCCMQLVMRPEQFDMLVMENLLRRHRLRSLCRPDRRPRTGTGCEYRRAWRRLRGGPRLGTRHRRPGHRQPDRAHALGHPDAALHRRKGSRRPF